MIGIGYNVTNGLLVSPTFLLSDSFTSKPPTAKQYPSFYYNYLTWITLPISFLTPVFYKSVQVWETLTPCADTFPYKTIDLISFWPAIDASASLNFGLKGGNFIVIELDVLLKNIGALGISLS